MPIVRSSYWADQQVPSTVQVGRNRKQMVLAFVAPGYHEVNGRSSVVGRSRYLCPSNVSAAKPDPTPAVSR